MNETVISDSIKFLPDLIAIEESQDLFIIIQKLGVAILIGLLVGLEREHAKPPDEKIFAGIRTFPLISTFGFLSGLISSLTSLWVYIALFIGFAGFMISAYIYSAKDGKIGGTSETSAFLVYLLGSLVYWNYIIIAAVIAIVIVLFLSTKFQLHSFVGKVNTEDIFATIKFGIITVIILPLLPDKTFGPLDVLNPRLIWYMVIFISGISFIGYIFIKIFGKDKGISVTALMGGMVSSTAVAVSLSRKSRENKLLSESFANGIIIASTVMYPRVLVVVSVLNFSLLSSLWLPVLIFTITGFGVSYFFYKKNDESKSGDFEMRNPFELKSALLFGFAFAAVIFISKAAQVYLGTGGIFAASALAGITSVDAIVLSLAKLTGSVLTEKNAIAAILIALISNTVVKGIIAFLLGTGELKKKTFTGLGILLFVSVVYLVIFLLI